MEYTCIHLKPIIIAHNSPITFWKVATPSEKSMTLWKFYVLVKKGADMDSIEKMLYLLGNRKGKPSTVEPRTSNTIRSRRRFDFQVVRLLS